jgi:hypothetical protein
VSLLVPLLQERGLGLTPLEATLAYAGIWEDTGGFSFPSTTPLDLEAAHFLALMGAEIPRVRTWVRAPLGPEARAILQELLKSARVVEVEGFRLLLARAKEEGYVPALAPLAHTLLDLHEADGVLLVLRLGKEALLIARSRARLDVARWLAQVGGGGHPPGRLRPGQGGEAGPKPPPHHPCPAPGPRAHPGGGDDRPRGGLKAHHGAGGPAGSGGTGVRGHARGGAPSRGRGQGFRDRQEAGPQEG